MIATTATKECPGALTFHAEADLVRTFVSTLETNTSPWGAVELTTEWDYRTGITDVLIRSSQGDIMAFEAKLSDWRRAAHQAYRNTVFAHQAYVLLPARTAAKAVAAKDVFARFNIGLCSVDDAGINVLIEAPRNEALMPWLRVRAMSFFDNESSEQRPGRHSGRSGGDLRTHRRIA